MVQTAVSPRRSLMAEKKPLAMRGFSLLYGKRFGKEI